jgi:UDP-N-acetylglucosamine 2-epimerase (non-hydrolysing)
MTKTIVHVVGARPNFMKIAPLMEALRPVEGIRQILVNTGQHYDEAMARGFIRELQRRCRIAISKSDRDARVQTANVMVRFETVCQEERRT